MVGLSRCRILESQTAHTLTKDSMPLPEVRASNTSSKFSEDWNFWNVLEIYGEARKCETITSSGSPCGLGGSGEFLWPGGSHSLGRTLYLQHFVACITADEHLVFEEVLGLQGLDFPVDRRL